MLNILQVTTGTTWSGGQEQIYQLSKGLAQKGHLVTVISPPGSILGNKLEKINIPVEQIRMKSELDFLAIPQILKVLSRKDFDLINVHRPTAHMLAWVAAILKRIPVFIVTRRVAHPIRNPLSAKIKYTFKVSKVIAVSQDIRQVLIQSGVHPSHIEVIHSGTDLERFDPTRVNRITFRQTLGLSASQPLVGVVGNHSSQNFRGHTYFLESAAKVIRSIPGAQFVIIGHGTLSEDLFALREKLQLAKHLCILGFREDIPEVLAGLDLLVNPAVTEGFSGIIREAMAMKKPVLATQVGGNPELIEDGINGLLIPPADSNQLAEKIIYLLNHRDLALDMANRGRALIEKKFSIQRMVENTEQLYDQVIQNKK
jgi:glycosyltransferase involved in cell wall biosynthesis